MSTTNHQLTRAASQTRTGVETAEAGRLLAVEDAGPTCARCDASLDYVDVEAVDRGRSRTSLRRGERPAKVVEHVRCPGCGAGGHRIRQAATDTVVRSVGTAFPGFRGEIQNRIEMGDGPAPAADPKPVATSWDEVAATEGS
jgi:hypothetical protein